MSLDQVSKYALQILQTAMDNANEHFSKSMEIAHQKALKEQAEKEAREQADRKEAERMVGRGPQPGDTVRAVLEQISELWNFSSEDAILMRSVAWLIAFLLVLVFRGTYGPLRVSVDDLPEWRRREVHVDMWLRVLLALLFVGLAAVIFLPEVKAGLIPSQWEVHSSRDCSSDSLRLEGVAYVMRRISEEECRAQCHERSDCSFASWSSSTCTLYSQCQFVSRSQFKLFQKRHSDAKVQLGPLLLSNLLVLLFPSISGIGVCSVVVSLVAWFSFMGSFGESGEAAGASWASEAAGAVALHAVALALQFASHWQLQERRDRKAVTFPYVHAMTCRSGNHTWRRMN